MSFVNECLLGEVQLEILFVVLRDSHGVSTLPGMHTGSYIMSYPNCILVIPRNACLSENYAWLMSRAEPLTRRDE